MIVKVSSKGQIVLPAALRKKYCIDAGSDLAVVDMGGSIYLVPLGDRDPVEELRGLLKGIEGLSSEGFLAERRSERDQDEGELE
ncbi:MAG: AbrB/MazE/SpoVT family DNA-binding domain-containing protein [Coriobacteriia bacterium]|nr:AbrB/MazE/SpoVT family DNA-binding domain-containing protein [Coriobacteriia bacterium]